MKKNLLSLLFLSLFALSSAFAQSRKISGTVTGADDGLSLPGVSVKVQGTTIGTQTNSQGSYSLTVPQGAKALVFSYIGYGNKTVVIGSQSVIDIKLSPDSKTLNEVVVVGYGTGVKASDAVGEISTVGAAQIENKPVANALDALQGKVAGLTMFSSTGEPSATPTFTIHGVGSLTSNNTPLIVMDGIPIDVNTIISLNPDDFESVSVLKDAASTSIYGSRAANGVVYITTKKGQLNRPPTINLTTQYSVSQLANTDYFNRFMDRSQYIPYLIAFGMQTQAQINTAIAGLGVQDADTKWYKVYYKNNTGTYNTNFSVSGGGGKTTYFVSGNYFRADGLAYRSLYDRYALRSNVASTVTNWMKFGLNLSMGYDERQTNQYGSNSTNRGLALLAAPYYSPTGPDGRNYDFIPGWGRYHPQYLANENPDPNNNTQFNPTAYLELTPIKGLTLKTQGGMDAYDYRETATRLPSNISSPGNGSVAEYFTRGVSKTFTNTAEYKFTVKSVHNFTALAGQEYSDGSTNVFGASSTGQTDDRLVTVSAGPAGKNVTNTNPQGQTNTEYSFQSLFGRLDYNYNNRYSIEGSVRQDKSSRFGVNNRTARFYSVGATWKAKEENFFKNISWLDDLTVRASTGTTGNSAIGNYTSLASVGTNAYNASSGYGITSPGNPNLSWEKQQLTSVGVTVSFFDRIRLDASYYIRKTTDMLISVPYAYTSGFSSVTSNTGALQNKGADIELDFDVWKDRSHNGFFTPRVVVNINHDKVISLFQGKNYWIIPGTGVSWAVGQPVSFFYPVFAGVDPASGSPLWYNPDSNPDKVVNKTTTNGVTSNFSATALQQSTGINRNSWLNGSFGFDAGFEGLTISTLFNFSKGKYLINNDRYFFENPNQFPNFNQFASVLNYWKNPGDITQFPKLGTQFTQFDSRLIEDASFIRLKELTIGYAIPKSILQRTKVVKGFKVFLTGRDLLTWTKYLGPDPEVDSNLALGTNPNTKQYSLGVQVTF